MTEYELARALFRNSRDVVMEGFGGTLPSYQVEAVAVSDSDDGTVLVALDGETFTEDGDVTKYSSTSDGTEVTLAGASSISAFSVDGKTTQEGETITSISSLALVVTREGVEVSSTTVDLDGNELRSLPDGTCDVLFVGEGGSSYIAKTVGVTLQAETDGIEGTVGQDIISSTGVIEDGATVLYPLYEVEYVTLPQFTYPEVEDGDVLATDPSAYFEVTWALAEPVEGTITPDMQFVAVPCSGAIEEGDTLVITVQANKFVDSTATGWGDRVNARAIEALDLSGIAQTAATEAQQVASDTSRGVAEAQALAEAASSSASGAAAAAENAQATADAAQSAATETSTHFWADEGGAHVSTEENKVHETGAGYNMTLGATDSTTGIILDHDDETLASFTPSALNFYADGQVAGSYTKDGVGLYAQDENDDAQQVAAFTASGVTFFDGAGNDAENILATFGKDGAVIGAQGGTQVAITDQLVAFVDGGDVVASISGQELEISAATVTDRLSIGQFAWIPRSNGNLALKWMG